MPLPPKQPPQEQKEGQRPKASNRRAHLLAWAVAAMAALCALSASRAARGIPSPAAGRAAGRAAAAVPAAVPGGPSLRGAGGHAIAQERGEENNSPAPGQGKSGDGGVASEDVSPATEKEKDAPKVAAPAHEQEGSNTASAGVGANGENSPATEKEKEAPTVAAPTQEQEVTSTAPGDVGVVASTAESSPSPEKQKAEMPAREEDGKDTAPVHARIDGGGGESEPSDEKGGRRGRTVAVAMTITACGEDPRDGAAVAQYSVVKHQELKGKHGSPSRYQYHFYALYHPSAKECALLLADLNFTLLERESPVLPEDIREGSDLKNDIAESGCCGEKELIKFEAFNLVQHDAVVLLDMDTLVLKSLDDALDLLLDGTVPAVDPASHIMFHPERPIPEDVWLLYTGDYETVPPEVFPKPVQGGFAIFKPNRTIYNEIVGIVREGQWSYQFGWGTEEAHTTNHWGSQTFQGLMPYYFSILNPGHSIELNCCQYNGMNTRPYWPNPDEDPALSRRCLTNREKCEDCRDRTFNRLSSFHFTICKKPWRCADPLVPAPGQDDKQKLCHEAVQAWFDYRSEMEASWGRTGRGSHWTGNQTLSVNHWGYCSWFSDDPDIYHGAASEYDPIRLPYGRAAIDAATDESR